MIELAAGRIKSVGTSSTPPAGANSLDCAGLTAYPGFIDSFNLRAAKAPPNPSEEGRPSTTDSAPNSIWIGNRKGISPDFSVAENLDYNPDEAVYKAGITSAFFSGSRGSMRGVGALLDALPATYTDRAVASNLLQNFSYRNGTGNGYPSNILGVIALFRQTLFDAKALNEGAKLGVEGDKKPNWMKALEALQPAIQGKQSVTFEANTEREILRSLEIAAEFGLKSIIQGGREAYKVANLLKAKGIPVILNSDPGLEPVLKSNNENENPADATPQAYRQERHDRWLEQQSCAKQLTAAGVQFSFSAETGSASMLDNVRKLITAGLDRNTALQAMTSNASSIFGLDKELGTIEPGKRANIVLMSGDYVSEKSEVRYAWVNGRRMFTTTGGKS